MTGRQLLFPPEPDVAALTEDLLELRAIKLCLPGRPEPVHQEIYRLLEVKDTLARRHRYRRSVSVGTGRRHDRVHPWTSPSIPSIPGK